MPDGGDIEKVVIGNATLYRGNCLEVMHLIEGVTHTICDPPYEEHAHTASRQVATAEGLVTQAHRFAAMDDATRSAITKAIIDKTERWALFFCQNEGAHYWRQEIIKSGGKYNTTMVWCKPDGKPNYNGTGPGVGFEEIVCGWCNDGRSSWNGGGRTGIFIINKNEERTDGNTHTTIKPQKLMRELVELFSNKDESILDCFMGSGSTGVAAVSLGRRFIGIERDPEYFEICCKRIEEAQREGLINTHYIKTKAKLTAPLLAEAFEKKQPAIAPKKAKAKKVDNKLSTPSAIKRPMITIGASSKSVVSGAIDRKAFAAVAKRPFIDPFLAFHQQTLAAAGAEPMTFDEASWNWDDKSAVGFDVECYQNFFLVCFKRFSDGKRITFERSERRDIDKPRLEHILHNNLLISFNGDNYDIPMIFYALKGANCTELKHASDRIIKTGMKRWDVERELGVSIPKLPQMNHIDLMEPNPSVRQSLKTLGGRLHQRFLVDLPYDEDARLDRRQMNFTTIYCFNDIETNEILYEALKEPLELRIALSREYKIDMRSKSDAQVGEAIIKKRVETETGKKLGKADSIPSSFRYTVPPFISFEDDRLNALLGELGRTDFHLSVSGKVETPKALDNLKIEIGESTYTLGIGGLHSNDEHMAIVADENNLLIDTDCSSQYPSIILKLALYPKAIGPKFLDIYKKIVDERLVAKAAGDKVKADTGKIIVNGVFGKLGSAYSALYAPHLLIAVTLTGQLSLLMLIERFEAEGIKVKSGNTDGVVALCPRNKEPLFQEIVKKWEVATGFQTEQTHYKALYSRDVNCYLAIKEDGKVKRKGPIANPWADHDTRGQLSKNPQMSVISDAVLSYIQNGTPIENSIRSCTDPRAFVTIINVKGGGKWRGHKLGRVVRYYWSTDGDPITYVSNDKQVSKSEGARPAMEIPAALWDDINYDKYIEEAKKLAVDLAVIKAEQEGLL